MNGAGSDAPGKDGADVADTATVEVEDAPTRFEYGDGGVPIIVGVLWVAFIVCYVVVMAAVALPDLISWVAS